MEALPGAALCGGCATPRTHVRVYYTRARVNGQAYIHPETMPGRGTPIVSLRLPEALWRRLGEAAEAAGTNRAEVIRALIRWYVRDGKLPPRP